VLFGVLVLVPSIRRAREAGDPLSGVDPPPSSLVGRADARRTAVTRIAGTATLVLVGVVVLTQADQTWVFLVTQAVVLSLIFLSVTIVTGFGGMISLCQGTFAAIGAFTVYQLFERYDIAVLPAALVGAVIAAAAGALLSLPIRRLSGIWVAIATLAFAFFFDSVMVRLSWVGGGDTAQMQGTRVPRPTLGPWDLASDKSFLVLAAVVLVVVALAVVQVREGTTGQMLRALRGSEVAAQSVGISPARVRLTAFALSAFVAGLGGALLAIQQKNVNYSTNFSPFAALFWVVLVVTLGSRTVEGAVNAGGAFALFDTLILKGTVLGWILRSPDRIPGIFPLSPKWRFVLFGLAAVQFARHPEGLIEAGKRRSAARAERRRSRRAAATPGSGRAEPSSGVPAMEESMA
jgi:ABC-type branched-subunit amino acid transport system permease subunit